MVLLRIASIVALARTAQALHHVSPSTRRRFAAYAANNNGDDARRVVFLGSPGVAALTLEALLDASAEGRGNHYLLLATAQESAEFLDCMRALKLWVQT